MIDGVKVKKLRIIPDDRGRLMEILRCDEDLFIKFGQVYMTTAYPGIIKAWHYHEKQTDSFTCVHGKIRLALYDARESSPTYKEVNEFVLSLEDPILIQIPNFVYHGFKGIADKESIVVNCPTLPYNREEPDEFRLDAFDNDIPYDWKRQ
ncbi:dTDP-4-dehydrorhamnose 3,5-epimerase family protein [Candidatus Omnitrophota bacterium]